MAIESIEINLKTQNCRVFVTDGVRDYVCSTALNGAGEQEVLDAPHAVGTVYERSLDLVSLKTQSLSLGVRQARSGPKNYMMHILIVIGFWAVFCGSAEMSRVSIEVVESIVNSVLFTSTVRRHQSRWVCQCRMDACGCVFKIFVNWRIMCRQEP